MMNKRSEFNKSSNGLTTDALKARIEEDQVRLRKIEFAHAISPMENPMNIRALRRDIARLKTALQNKVLDI